MDIETKNDSRKFQKFRFPKIRLESFQSVRERNLVLKITLKIGFLKPKSIPNEPFLVNYITNVVIVKQFIS